jgi:dethiobiotin synthetase
VSSVLFITGTDTGVGKTLLTAMLLRHLRENGHRALAMKPFCSGSRADAKLLCDLQDGELSLDEVNPYFFAEPLAPWVAAQKKRRKQVQLDDVFEKIDALKTRCEVLLIEGSGGILVPLGENYCVADLISRLRCPALIVARNRLGTINHSLLTLRVMQTTGNDGFAFVMMGAKTADLSARNNVEMLQKLSGKTPVFQLGFLGDGASKLVAVKKNAKKSKKVLAQIAAAAIFTRVLSNEERKDCSTKKRC